LENRKKYSCVSLPEEIYRRRDEEFVGYSVQEEEKEDPFNNLLLKTSVALTSS